MEKLIKSSLACHLTAQPGLHEFEEFPAFYRVTSDCKPFARGGRLAISPTSGLVQTVVNDVWRDEIKRIYGDYTIYFQSEGIEQAVFDTETGAALSRSARITELLKAEDRLPTQGSLLDVGCGNGSFLKCFQKGYPEWSLNGTEWDEKYAATVCAIPNVRAHFTGALEAIDQKFDLISLIHVLEHIENPLATLRTIRSMLTERGQILIEVPFYKHNPFELLIADHVSHFSKETLEATLRAAGFEILLITHDWVKKELTLLARPDDVSADSYPQFEQSWQLEAEALQKKLAWLRETVSKARSLRASAGQFGLFGTSIAANWLFTELDNQVDFFVDEDPSRVGTSHFNKPVLSPREIPQGSHVYIPLAPIVAQAVAQRLHSNLYSLHTS